MKISLVAGGAGFLGSHLCRALLEKGKNVICIDNLSTGSIDNIEPYLSSSNFRFIKQDILEPIDLSPFEIYNLACPASPAHYQKDPIQTLRSNTIGVLNLLELARKNKARILQSSTSEIYGDPAVHPQTEGYFGNVNPVGPRACYDEGKRVAETLFYEYQRQYGVETKIVRIFNTYGPNMDKEDGRVVSNFINQALRDVPLTIYGNGEQTRSFCYVDDLIKGLIASMEYQGSLGPINLGSDEEIKILDLANAILAFLQKDRKINFSKLPQDDPKIRKPDLTMARELLFFTPRVLIKEGLIKTIQYFKTSNLRFNK
jgi:UDP-glucuronate decarboxylase